MGSAFRTKQTIAIYLCKCLQTAVATLDLTPLLAHRCADESIDELAAYLGVGAQVAAMTAR